MIVLYCDDSFFYESEYSQKMNHKLEVILKESLIQCVCISITKKVDEQIDAFAAKFPSTTFIKSHNFIQFEENKFELTDHSLNLNEEQLHPFSGTICLVDTISCQWQRYYLDLFPDQETDVAQIINDFIEDFMHELFSKTDKEN